MGAKCCAESAQADVPTGVVKLEDLPAVNIEGITDRLQRLELSLPFTRTLISVFEDKLNKAHADCGDDGYITLKALRTHLDSAAWAPIADPSSNLTKMLLSASFKADGQEADQIDFNYILMFALIHCAGKPIDKARTFYAILQDGGLEAHTQISATDKDFEPTFYKMCSFVTKDIVQMGVLTEEFSNMYTDDEFEKLESNDALEIVKEDQWLEEVYGAQSRLDNDEWLSKVQKDGNWIFDAKELRKRLFAAAEVEYKN